MTATANKRTIYAGDDLVVNVAWKEGTKKEPGDPINLTDTTLTTTIVRNGVVVVTGTVTKVDAEGKIKASFSEAQTLPLSGTYEVRLRFTDTAGETTTILVMPLEVRK